MKNRLYIVLLGAIALSGCSSTPETPTMTAEQWIYHMKQGSFLRGTTETTIDRPIPLALADITEYADKCINGKVVKTSVGSGIQRSTSTVRHTSGVQRTASGVNIFFMQSLSHGYYFPGMPENGYHGFAAELSGDGKRTRITSYYPALNKKYLAPFEDWAKGNKGTCPDLS